MIDGYVKSNSFLRHFILIFTILCAIVLMVTASLMTIMLRNFRKYQTPVYIVLTLLFWLDSLQNWVITTTRYAINFTNSFTYLKCSVVMTFSRILDSSIFICVTFLSLERLLRLYAPSRHLQFITKKLTCYYLSSTILAFIIIITIGDGQVSLNHITNVYQHVDICLYFVVFDSTYGFVSMIIFHILPCLILFVTGVILIYRSQKEMKKDENPPPYVQNAEEELRMSDIKLAYSIGVISLIIGLFHLPINIIEILEIFDSYDPKFDIHISSWLVGVSLLLPIILPIFETIVFLCINGHLRKDIIRALEYFSGSPQNEVYPHNVVSIPV